MKDEDVTDVVARAGEAGYFAEARREYWLGGYGEEIERRAVAVAKEQLLALVGRCDEALAEVALGVAQGTGRANPHWEAYFG